MQRRTIVAIAAAVVLVVAGSAYFVPKLLRHGTGQGIPNAITSVDVKNAPSGTSFAIEKLANPPAPTIPDARPLGQAVEITPTGDPGDTTELHFHLNRAVLPHDEPDCHTPTTQINLGIAAYNPQLQAWIPLSTTCTGDELVAIAPHFSKFWSFIVDAGKHVVSAVVRGVQKTVEVVTTIATSLVQYTIDLVKNVVLTFFRNLLGLFDNAKYVCQPPSTRYEVTVSASTTALAGCMVAANNDDELHFKNGLAVPLAFDMPTNVRQYVTGQSSATSVDILGLIESTVALLRGKSLVTGLEAGTFKLATQTPGKLQLDATGDTLSVMLDLAIAVLTVIAPSFRATSVEVRGLMVEVESRLTVIVGKEGAAAISIVRVRTTFEAVVKEHPNWAFYADTLLKIIDGVKCFTSQPYTGPGAMTDTVFNCLSTIFAADKAQGELKQLLLAIITQVKVIPELVQADLADKLKLAGFDLTKVRVVINPKCPSGDDFHTMVQAASNTPGSQAIWVKGREFKATQELCEDGWVYGITASKDAGCGGYCDGVHTLFHWVAGRWELFHFGGTGAYFMPYDNDICNPLPPKIKADLCIAGE
jgi:hypothetical protein